ncbi:N-acetyltransferase family protein [Glutamicibacter sp.]|uniref:GNAT family N-acetyltransferase n=1 Tax=Glutamicibacter sp. TaxID=1931995 RepID=UPI003D6B2C42
MARKLRKPLPADAQELAKLHVDCWKETYTGLLPDGFFDLAHEEQRLGMWARVLNDPNPLFRISVAESEDGKLVGFAFSAPPTGNTDGMREDVSRQLYNLYLLEDFHGDGTGQALLDAVLGDEPAMLWVAAQNPRAIRFYERNGFAFDGVTEDDPTAPKITDARMLR